MHLSVHHLRDFYYRSALGRATQRVLRQQVQAFWPTTDGQTLAGFGFAVPLLRPYLEKSRRVIGLMPAPQGVMAWPQGLPNASVLCEETSWPIDTGHIDRLIVMHGLESSEQPSALLDECWRVLGPGGRALFIVPNRSGLWARSDLTPFGYGRPYSLGQLQAQLTNHQFMTENHSAALYGPPSSRRFWMQTAMLWEQMGASVSAMIAGGVILVEVSKRVQASSGTPVMERMRRPLNVLVPNPAAKPVLQRKVQCPNRS